MNSREQHLQDRISQLEAENKALAEENISCVIQEKIKVPDDYDSLKRENKALLSENKRLNKILSKTGRYSQIHELVKQYKEKTNPIFRKMVQQINFYYVYQKEAKEIHDFIQFLVDQANELQTVLDKGESRHVEAIDYEKVQRGFSKG